MMNMIVALKVTLTYYNSSGGSLGSESVVRNANNGAPKYWDADIGYEVLFLVVILLTLEIGVALFKV